MSTKEKKSTTALTPVVHFYMSEDLRQEIDGKVNAMGIIGDHTVLLPLPDNVPDPTESNPIVLRSLCFLFSVSKINETTTISIESEGGGRQLYVLEPREFPAQTPGTSTNLILKMEPCGVSSFGEKKMILTIGGIAHEFHYEIRRQRIPSANAPIAPKIMTAKKPLARLATAKAKKAKSAT